MDLTDERGTEGVIYLDFTRLVKFSWSFLKNTIINNLENYDLDLKNFELDNYNLGMGTFKNIVVCIS